MADITYCLNSNCPFTDCEKHCSKIKEAASNGKGYVSVSNFDGMCRRYIGYLVEHESRLTPPKGEEHNE